MKDLKYFSTNNDYTTNKSNFTYPTVSYVEEDTKVYYVNPPASLINIHYEIKDEEQLQMINDDISTLGNKLPLLMRSDLIEEAKLDGYDITSQLHKGEPYVFTSTTSEDKIEELMSLSMGESGWTDYVIATDGPFEVGSSWDLEVKFKDGITDCIGLFDNSIALSEISENLFSNCTAVTDFSWTFLGCSGLTSIPEKLFSNNTAVTNFSYTFQNCTGLTGNVPVDSDGTPIYNRSGLGKEEYAIVTNHVSCFCGCDNLTDYNLIPNDWRCGTEPTVLTYITDMKNLKK